MRHVHSDSNPSAMPTVLVLDDEPFVRHAARRFLKGSGYGCVESETVEGAIELLHTTPVIAAMLDMRLPCGRTGLDVLADIRQVPEFREIPVLIVTGQYPHGSREGRHRQAARLRVFQARRIFDDREFSRPPDRPRSQRMIRACPPKRFAQAGAEVDAIGLWAWSRDRST